jgi:acyl carrier protein phosphodiesterase
VNINRGIGYLDQMNFLAHLYLSGDDPKVMVGNFIADFVKGKEALQQYESEIVFGIELHRSIDAFTDRHPVVKASKKRLVSKYRHYAAVIVDMYFDHFLSNRWNEFHTIPLEIYSRGAYKLLEEHNPILPPRLKGMLPYMIRGNWLVGYGSIDGIGQALSGMARRTPYQSRMEEAETDLRNNYDAFAGDFMSFFPELRTYSLSILNSRTST